MKKLTLIFLIMQSVTASAQDGKATSVKQTFNQQTSVQIDIDADASIVWALLTNASDFPRWNSTIISLEGEIRVGRKIRLKSYLDDKRIFKIKVKEMVPESRMVWGDGKGKRVFSFSKNGQGVTFFMHEKIGGLMYPMYAKYLPPFEESFERFAADLKKEAEIISQTR